MHGDLLCDCGTCYKCKNKLEDTVPFSVGKELACRPCFVYYIENGFRKILRTKCSISQKTKFAIAFSGGSGSLSLLRLCMRRSTDTERRRVEFKGEKQERIHVVYVDLPALFGVSSDSSLHYTTSFPELRLFDFAPELSIRHPSLASSLLQEYIELYMKDSFLFHAINPLDTVFCSAKALKYEPSCVLQLFQNAPRDSSKDKAVLEDLLHIIRTRALCRWSETSDCPPSLLVGDSANRLSSVALHQLSQGGGSQIPLLCRFCDPRFASTSSNEDKKNVLFFRPLKKFPASELNTYLSMFYPPIDPPKCQVSESKQSVVDRFIDIIQTTNHQTVHTITQTLEKLSSFSIEFCNDGFQCTFPYGQCLCCFGCMESASSKGISVSLWTDRQLQCIHDFSKSPLYSDTFGGMHNINHEMKHPLNTSNTNDMQFVLKVLSPLCIRCSNLAASSPCIREVVFFLVHCSFGSSLINSGS